MFAYIAGDDTVVVHSDKVAKPVADLVQGRRQLPG